MVCNGILLANCFEGGTIHISRREGPSLKDCDCIILDPFRTPLHPPSQAFATASTTGLSTRASPLSESEGMPHSSVQTIELHEGFRAARQMKRNNPLRCYCIPLAARLAILLPSPFPLQLHLSLYDTTLNPFPPLLLPRLMSPPSTRSPACP